MSNIEPSEALTQPPDVLSVMGDMVDSVKEIEKWPNLSGALKECEEYILPAYRDADQAAIRHQKHHKRLTKLAAVFGTAAVLIAIGQLAFHKMLELHIGKEIAEHYLIGLELVSVTLALIAVVLGIVSVRLNRWLVERYKAERLRSIKFRFLLNPAIWSTGQLKTDVDAVNSITVEEIHEELEQENPPFTPPQPPQTTEDQTLSGLIKYYRVKRLEFQRTYFQERIDLNEDMDKRTREWPRWLFFGSIAAVFIHFIFHLCGLEEIGRVFTFLAAALPAFAGGVRIFRSANEYARNLHRYRAKEATLSHWLEKIRGHGNDNNSIIRELWYCEAILEFENQEWCRLMIESEWY